MYSAPPTGFPEPFVLTSMSQLSLGAMNVAAGRGAGASVAWGTANQPTFVPFVITTTRTYTGMLWMNGGTVDGLGNVNGAIYSADGTTALGTIGSVLQAGTTTVQKKAFPSAVTLAPGRYFMALVFDSATNTVVSTGLNTQLARAIGVRIISSFFALTATAAAWTGTTSTRVPLFGIYEASWL